MKLTILGGGGFRVPLIYQALLADESAQRVTQLRLFDTDQQRLSAISAVLAELAAGASQAPIVIATTDIDRALAGADFVFSAIRVGGTAGRALDERIALRHGVIGQETVGAGGTSYALRGIPVVLDLVANIKQHCPQAWVINFTNPAGIMTEVMQRELGSKVIGICDSPVGLGHRVVTTLQSAGLVASDVDTSPTSKEVQLEYAGLNHLGWLTGLRVRGVNVLPQLLERPTLIESFEEGRLFGADLIQALGAVPNEYLHYYYFARENYLIDQASEETRGAFLANQQDAFFHSATQVDSPLALWERTRLEREANYMATNREAAGNFERDKADLESGGYDKVALAIMHAISGDTPAELILNVANGSVFSEVMDTAVIEVPCVVDASGARPLPGAKIPDHGRALTINQNYIERCTIAAATTGSRRAALLALANNPLVDSFNVAKRLLDEFIDNQPELTYLQ